MHMHTAGRTPPQFRTHAVFIALLLVGSLVVRTSVRAAEPRADLPSTASAPASSLRVLYIHGDDLRVRNELASLLELNGFTVTALPMTTTALSAAVIARSFDRVVIGDDTGIRSVSGVYWVGDYDLARAIEEANVPLLAIGFGGSFYHDYISSPLAPSYSVVTDLVRSVAPAERGQDAWNEPEPVSLQRDGSALLFDRAVETVILTTTSASLVTLGSSPADVYGYGYAVLSELRQTRAGDVCYTMWGFRAPLSAMTVAGRRLLMNLLAGSPCQPLALEQVDLAVGAVASRDAVTVGLPVTVTVLVTNTSIAVGASDVRLRNTLPASAAIGGVRASQGRCTRAGTDLACRLGNLAAGAVASVTVTMRPETGGVSMRNVAAVWSAAQDDDDDDNVFTRTVRSLGTVALDSLIGQPVLTGVVLPPPMLPQDDLGIHGIEVTSGIQCFDTSQGLANCPDNSLPVILMKDTMVRVYLSYTPSLSIFDTKLTSVPVALDIFADGVTTTLNSFGTASRIIDRGVHDAAEFLVRINGNADKQVRFTAHVDPNNVLTEQRENNNRSHATVTFQRQRQNLDIAAVRWRRTFGGVTYTPQGWAVTGGAANWMNAVLPIRNNGVRYTLLPTFKTYTQSMSTGDAQHAAIIAMNGEWIWANTLGGLFGSPTLEGKDMYYGWFSNTLYSGGHADMPIYPHAGGLGIVGIGTDRVGDGNRTVDNPGGGTLIFGHELVHDFNVMHTNTADGCGSSDGATDFPYGSSSIQEFGFNPTTGQIYDPANTHDLMSYCPAGGSTFGWISPFTWLSMTAMLDHGTAARYSQAAAPATAASSLAVSLRVSNPYTDPEDQTASFTSVALVEDETTQVLPQEGPYVLELRAADETVLASYPFSISFHSEYAGHVGEEVFPSEETADAGVVMRVPWNEAAVRLVATDGARVLGEHRLSVSAPMAAILEPSAPITPAAGTTITLSWAGLDADGDALTYSVLYSRNGEEWSMLAQEIPSTTLEIAVDDLPGGDDAAFAVVASDGFRIGSAQTSEAIVIPGHAPEALISSAAPETSQPVGTLVQLNGAGFDYEDGTLPEVMLDWAGSRTGPLGSGASIAVPDLELGRHVFTLTVTDSDGRMGAASIVLNVLPSSRTFVPLVRR